jgi:broad specificity phosphatase PhoE
LLETTDVRALYTSPLRRARETAEIIAQLVKVIVRVDANLREIDAGIPADLSVEEAGERFPDLLADGRTMPGGPFPGGESLDRFQQRIRASVDRVLSRHPDEAVAIVTHGGPIVAYLRAFLGFAAHDDAAPFFACDAASTHRLHIDGEARTIVRINDIAHLDRVPAAR